MNSVLVSYRQPMPYALRFTFTRFAADLEALQMSLRKSLIWFTIGFVSVCAVGLVVYS
jgi:hypothetical protein